MSARASTVVDFHVGSRLRARRKELKIGQPALAEALGLTFQQVQKYERGANRISASKLYEAATFLQVPIAYFFEGLSDDGGNVAAEFLASDEGAKLAQDFVRLPPEMRSGLLALVRSMVKPD